MHGSWVIEVPKIKIDPLTKKALSVEPEAGDINRIEIVDNMLQVEYVNPSLVLETIEIPLEEVEKSEDPAKYVQDKIKELIQYKNIIIKFGRYIPNKDKRFDEVLGVWLASDNQFAAKY